jgi:hypothetical protein
MCMEIEHRRWVQVQASRCLDLSKGHTACIALAFFLQLIDSSSALAVFTGCIALTAVGVAQQPETTPPRAPSSADQRR